VRPVHNDEPSRARRHHRHLGNHDLPLPVLLASQRRGRRGRTGGGRAGFALGSSSRTGDAWGRRSGDGLGGLGHVRHHGVVGIDPIHGLYLAAILNGLAAPPLILLMLLLGNDRGTMGRWRSGRLSNMIVGLALLAMVVAPIAYLLT